MTTITLHTADLQADRAALVYQYDSQIQPQPAYVRMTEDGDVDAYTSGEIGNGVPMDVWHARTLTWSLPWSTDANALADLLETPEVLALLERVHGGHEVSWNGNNHVGELTEDAQDASEELSRILADAQTVDIWDADGLLNSLSFDDAWPEDMPLDAAAQAHIDSANAAIDGIVTATASEIKEKLLYWAQGRDDLSNLQLSEMVANDWITQAEADEAKAERDAD